MYISLYRYLLFNISIHFYRFPKDYRKQLWMDALQLKQISSWNRVCSTQFSVQSYMNNGSRNVLVRDAIPFAIRELLFNFKMF